MRRTLAALGAALAALTLSSACAGPVAPPAPAGGPPEGFPVTIEHRLGSAVIPAAPTRVVALGVPDIDAALALGVPPVGATAAPFGAGGVWAWDADALDTGAGTGGTTLLPAPGGNLSMEQVAALEPDLILAHSFAGIDSVYPRLAEIAPTVADAKGVLEDGWQDETLAVGRALGRAAQAQRLVDGVEQRIGDTAREHPGLRGARYAVGWAREPGSLTVAGNPGDATAELLGRLGLRLDDAVVALPRQGGGGGGTGAASLAFEQLGALDSDLLLVAANTPELKAGLESSPLFRRLAVVQQGRYQSIGPDAVSALRVPTVRNIGWVLDQIEPTLGKVGT